MKKKKFKLTHFIQGLSKDEISKKDANSILDKILPDSKDYKEEVLKMSNKELHEHVWDEEYHEDDFASKELLRRGIDKDGCYPCNGCQGGGCPNCSGYGTLSSY
jgi:hypothetical protein|tara:strand:+ start:336 stop:647 length:312 start_codon:yes stop_codon:yes gene_type:complete